jgi:hypothetical protein
MPTDQEVKDEVKEVPAEPYANYETPFPDEKPKADDTEKKSDEKPVEEEVKDEKKPEEKPKVEEPKLTDADNALLKEFGIEGDEAAMYAKSPKLLTALRAERQKSVNWQNEANRRGSQNKTVADELRKVKAKLEASGAGQASVREAMRASLKAKIEKMPDGVKRLAADEDLVETMLTMIEASEEAKKPAEKAPGTEESAGNETELSPEQVAVSEEALTREADAADRVVKEAGFPEYETTYKSPEFMEYMGQRVAKDIELAEKIKPGLLDQINSIPDPVKRIQALRYYSPSLALQLSMNPAGHIRLLGEYSSYQTEKAALAKKNAAADETKKDLAGHGNSGHGAPAGDGEYKDPMMMTDKEFKEYDRKVKSGG